MAVFADLLTPAGAMRKARETLAQARRDVAMVRLTLGGGVPAPTITRPPRNELRAREANLRTGDRARAVRVRAVTRETADAVTLELEDATGAALEHAPGQFFTVLVPLAGESLRRAYSVSSGPGERVAITVKRIADGRVSSHLVAGVRSGDVLRVLGPSGSFGDGLSGARHLVAVAGGSGITPIMSVVRHALARGVRVSLVYGNRGARDVIFKDALDALAGAHAPRLVVRHVLEHPDATLAATQGRLTRVVVRHELDALAAAHGGDDDATHYLVCGPTPMMDAARAEVFARGVPRSRIHEELFVRPELRKHGPGFASPAADVTVRVRGKTILVHAEPGQSLLDAALAAGAPMPFSCAIGGCGACKVKLVSGTVALEEPSCLSEEERARGEILTCVGHATSDCALEVP